MGMRSKYTKFCLVCSVFLCLSLECMALSSRQCLSQAETYFEQVYCEAKAKRPSALPDYLDFKKNTEQVQALLLKPVAKKIGITIIVPKTKSTAKAIARRVEKARAIVQAAENMESSNSVNSGRSTLDKCSQQAKQVHCDGSVFMLLGNKSNKQIPEAMFAADNRLNFPAYVPGGAGEAGYVSRLYGVYIQKMIDIGLAGATLSYAKFHFLFYDLKEKGVSFNDRFEKMYLFLKKDKRNNAVSTQLRTPRGLSLTSCDFLNRYLVCNSGGKNWVYALRDGNNTP